MPRIAYNGAPNNPAMLEEQKKCVKSELDLESRGKFGPQILYAQSIMASIYQQRNTYLSYFRTIFLYLSIFIHSVISVFPSQSPSSSPSLSPFAENNNNSNKGNAAKKIAAFCQLMQKSPICIALLGRNGKTLKLKTTSKLKDKRTSIATVQESRPIPNLLYAMFPTPLGSHYMLPFKFQ
jgi:hypothetical protein